MQRVAALERGGLPAEGAGGLQGQGRVFNDGTGLANRQELSDEAQRTLAPNTLTVIKPVTPC